MQQTLFEKAMVDYHEGYADQMVLHSVGPLSLCHCGYSIPFGADLREGISHWHSIMVHLSPCYSQ